MAGNVASKNGIKCEYLETGDKYSCYGRGVCREIYPANFILVWLDEKGFYYPPVDEKLCVNCGKCRRICIWQKEKEQYHSHTLYAVQSKSYDVLEHCQSGELFDAVSDDFAWILNTENHGYEDIVLKEVADIFGTDSKHAFQYVSEIPKFRNGKT